MSNASLKPSPALSPPPLLRERIEVRAFDVLISWIFFGQLHREMIAAIMLSDARFLCQQFQTPCRDRAGARKGAKRDVHTLVKGVEFQRDQS